MDSDNINEMKEYVGEEVDFELVFDTLDVDGTEKVTILSIVVLKLSKLFKFQG